jgi:hypothetical protein
MSSVFKQEITLYEELGPRLELDSVESSARERGATHPFTRLNVSRTVRTFEAEDITVLHQMEADPAERGKQGA